MRIIMTEQHNTNAIFLNKAQIHIRDSAAGVGLGGMG